MNAKGRQRRRLLLQTIAIGAVAPVWPTWALPAPAQPTHLLWRPIDPWLQLGCVRSSSPSLTVATEWGGPSDLGRP